MDWRLWLLPAAVVLAASSVSPALGQIYNIQNGQVLPGTQGITPAPGIDVSDWNTPGHELEYAELYDTNLTNASFANSDLSNGSFYDSTLTNVNLTGAVVTGMDFGSTSAVGHPANYGFTAAQLYRTASYANGNLTGIGLENDRLSGWSFVNQNLTNADFKQSSLINPNFTGANLSRADVQNATFTNANFTNANLANVQFYYSSLSNANFTNATLVHRHAMDLG
jgi:uncharacterized protein YjbI with pentapeptide repeats